MATYSTIRHVYRYGLFVKPIWSGNRLLPKAEKGKWATQKYCHRLKIVFRKREVKYVRVTITDPYRKPNPFWCRLYRTILAWHNTCYVK